jgi:hypothetical protein
MSRIYRPASKEESGTEFTHESIEHALISHKEAGLIRSWWRDPRTQGASGTRTVPLYWVMSSDGKPIGLANVWEARALLFGLSSARQEQERRANAEARAREADAAEREQRLAAERAEDERVTAAAGCPGCGAQPGQRCTRDVRDDTPYAAHPHAARRDRARTNTPDDIRELGSQVSAVRAAFERHFG